jgi:hypothetical protein
VAQEFDEKCLSEPITAYDDHDDHDIGDGWLHEWELPERYRGEFFPNL